MDRRCQIVLGNDALIEKISDLLRLEKAAHPNGHVTLNMRVLTERCVTIRIWVLTGRLGLSLDISTILLTVKVDGLTVRFYTIVNLALFRA
ncbi:MAG: hypothetical protein LBB38_03120 [Puniceicoccales bacterium]|jgi:hypothetical protein|nr:hypothetical protein [Puniceicoccales bacterium]